MSGNTGAVPFLDLVDINADLQTDLEVAWKAVLQHGRFVGGPEVERFETQFAAYCESRSCVGVANGTDAIELILTALGIGGGDEVIIPANTFVATAEAVRAAGARPVFVDVRPDTLLMDPAAAAAAVNPRTAAIIGVHLFGQMVAVPALSSLADRCGLAFIEDAAQAHGARYSGQPAGSVGRAAAFSFYPGKNLGALGDGGAVVTSDTELADRVRRLANHGRAAHDRHRHELPGRNSRLDSIQAAALSLKLPRLDSDNARRRELMRRYRESLPVSLEPVAVDPAGEHVHHLAVVRTLRREQAGAALSAADVGWGVHYPVPCHLQPAFAGCDERLPVAEEAATQILSLPISPTLDDVDVVRVCDALRGV
ncbi:DegT/DnrJ/EryC1/StrS family aminotransferase [Saccharopolyspora shandongensis]|uniref:DegT/DnrJ/EryC1/StrS family aminotransferase n=1 Tax=Saccharopolyspora shandongensis TaxID=418495 RepID=UPI0033C62EB7